MARSGKYLYYTYNNSNYCVPLYNGIECFSCVPFYQRCLNINTTGGTYHALVASDKRYSDTTYLRFNNSYVYNGIYYKNYSDNGHCYNHISGGPGATIGLTFSACTVIRRCTGFDLKFSTEIVPATIRVTGYFTLGALGGITTKTFNNGNTGSVTVYHDSSYTCIISGFGATRLNEFENSLVSSFYDRLNHSESDNYY